MEPPSSTRIDLLNESGIDPEPDGVVRAVEAALAEFGASEKGLTILVATDGRVREFNARFRGVDQATDVLSFPSGEPELGYLGDVAIAAPFARRQAEARGVSFETEVATLAIHGALHLLGLDDETEADRAVMLRYMRRACERAGLPADPEWGSILHEREGEGA